MVKSESMRLILVLLFIAILSGCVQDYIISKPTIEPNLNWKIIEKCGYEGCLPLVDFLTSNDIEIRIQSFNHEKEIFLIKLGFYSFKFKSVEYVFNPSAVTVKLSNGEVLKPKGFTCSYTMWNLDYLLSTPSLRGAIPMSDNHCFLLFFDYPPPSVEEEFVMNLDGLKRNGEAIEVPTVYFKRGISRY